MAMNPFPNIPLQDLIAAFTTNCFDRQWFAEVPAQFGDDCFTVEFDTRFRFPWAIRKVGTDELGLANSASLMDALKHMGVDTRVFHSALFAEFVGAAVSAQYLVDSAEELLGKEYMTSAYVEFLADLEALEEMDMEMPEPTLPPAKPNLRIVK